MDNKEELDILINKINNMPGNISDESIKKIYSQAMNVLKSKKYSNEEKTYFKKKAWLEMLAMCYDGIE